MGQPQHGLFCASNSVTAVGNSNPPIQAEFAPIERFVWDLTYACPLRCVHCYSESGRRPSMAMEREDMLKVVDVLIQARPERVSFAGGEPLLVRWWAEAGRRLRDEGIPLVLFTGGWLMDEATAEQLADVTTEVAVSIDGTGAEIHDALRGRRHSFDRALQAVEILGRVAQRRRAQGRASYQLAIDYTVTRSGRLGLDRFVQDMSERFPMLDVIRFGAVIPEGLAQEEAFAAAELLSEEEMHALGASEDRLKACARHGVRVSVTDARYFLPTSELSAASAGIAHIEPDGNLRAFTNYEAKVGNVLHENLEILWSRALAWRRQPFVAEQLRSVSNFNDWAHATRRLDRRYGSEADRQRIARRHLPVRTAPNARGVAPGVPPVPKD